MSPDGKSIAFVALGDLWLMPVTGGKPQNLTNDAAYDVDPTWSPDGRYLAWSSDRAGGLLQIWIRDMQTGQMRQLTHIPTQPTSLQFSPDGKRIAFVNVDAMWRGAGVGGGRCGDRRCEADPQIDLCPRHAHLVAGRQAHRRWRWWRPITGNIAKAPIRC